MKTHLSFVFLLSAARFLILVSVCSFYCFGGLTSCPMRPLLGIGLTILAYSLWLMSGYTLNAGFFDIAWPRMVMGVGLGLFFVPLTTATFVDIPNEEMSDASGLFNLLRNLGGSFGVAFCIKMLARRTQLNQNFLVENINPFRSVFQNYERLVQDLLMSRDGFSGGGNGALIEIYREVTNHRQAFYYTMIHSLC